MQTTTLSFANLHNHGELFANMLRARRELFLASLLLLLLELLLELLCSTTHKIGESVLF